MTTQKYKVIALPFSQSDIESEFEVYGIDETDARLVFKDLNPTFMIKSITPA